MNSGEFQDVRMGQCIPENNLFAKLLWKGVQNCIPRGRETPSTLTFPIFRGGHHASQLMVLTTTGHPSYVPVPTSENPPEGSVSSETLTSCHYHGFWQPPMDSSKLPKRDEEKLFLRGPEVVHCDALKKPSETAKEGNGYRSRLTRSEISIHSSASTRSKLEIEVLPSLSSTIPAKVRTASPSSFALVTAFQSRW